MAAAIKQVAAATAGGGVGAVVGAGACAVVPEPPQTTILPQFASTASCGSSLPQLPQTTILPQLAAPPPPAETNEGAASAASASSSGPAPFPPSQPPALPPSAMQLPMFWRRRAAAAAITPAPPRRPIDGATTAPMTAPRQRPRQRRGSAHDSAAQLDGAHDDAGRTAAAASGFAAGVWHGHATGVGRAARCMGDAGGSTHRCVPVCPCGLSERRRGRGRCRLQSRCLGERTCPALGLHVPALELRRLRARFPAPPCWGLGVVRGAKQRARGPRRP